MSDDNYSKKEIDLILDGFESRTKIYFQHILSEIKSSDQNMLAEFKNAEHVMESSLHKMELAQRDVSKDVNGLKLITFASIFAIIASKFFHI